MATVADAVLTLSSCGKCGSIFSYIKSRQGRRVCDACKKARSQESARAFRERHRDRLRVEKREEANRRYRRDPTLRERMVEYNRRRALATFGLDEESVVRMYDAQDGKCAICGCPRPLRGKRGLHLDHDHETGSVRGLLCGNCNPGLGHFKDDPVRLLAAIAYLEIHRG